jgi:S1-C subfamily serine protease
MKYIIIAFISFFLIGCKEVSTTDIVNQKINGVVLISNDVTETQGGIGTGFIIGNKIVTNLHVVEGNGKITVYSGNSDRKYEAIVAFQDPVADIAVLTLKDWDAFKKNETPVGLEFGDSEEANVGDRVVVIGHPWGLLWSVSEGIISAKDRRVNQNPKFLDQTDAKLYQGNSGGPVFNEEGQVVCISNMMLSQEGGSYGFCIPSNLAKKVLYDFEKFGEVRWRVLNVLTELTDNGSTLILKTIEPNADFVDKKISSNIYWTFKKTERRDIFEEDLYNFKSYAWQQYNKFSQGKNAKNMWLEDARRLGRNI